jgi:hypothetical protein
MVKGPCDHGLWAERRVSPGVTRSIEQHVVREVEIGLERVRLPTNYPATISQESVPYYNSPIPPLKSGLLRNSCPRATRGSRCSSNIVITKPLSSIPRRPARPAIWMYSLHVIHRCSCPSNLRQFVKTHVRAGMLSPRANVSATHILKSQRPTTFTI